MEARLTPIYQPWWTHDTTDTKENKMSKTACTILCILVVSAFTFLSIWTMAHHWRHVKAMEYGFNRINTNDMLDDDSWIKGATNELSTTDQ